MKNLLSFILSLAMLTIGCSSEPELTESEKEIMDRVMSKVELEEPIAPDPIEAEDKLPLTDIMLGKWNYTTTEVVSSGRTSSMKAISLWTLELGRDQTFMKVFQLKSGMSIDTLDGTWHVSNDSLYVYYPHSDVTEDFEVMNVDHVSLRLNNGSQELVFEKL